MDVKYTSKNRDQALSQVVEECAEVTQVAMKIQRFGWNNHHPNTGEGNVPMLQRELSDLDQAIARLRTFLEDHAS